MFRIYFNRLVCLVVTLLVAAICLGQAAAAGQSANLIKNPSFEEGSAEGPAGWKPQTWGGEAEFKYVEGGRTGGKCVMVTSEKGADAGWQTSVALVQHSQYKLTAWIKTENVAAKTGKGALLNLHNIQPSQTEAVTGNSDWKQVELLFESGGNESVQINCLFGGWGLATGKAFFDDLSLELLSTRTMKPAVKIDAGATGEPISKYIYGQFIEHLGRCIYGGIWAEMLEDRKFYYPVGAKGSPWKIIGDAGNIKMSKENPFVGEHTPEISLPDDGRACGIQQGELGLIKGKEYTGRIIVAGDKSIKVSVGLVWGAGESERQTIAVGKLSSKYATKPLRFRAGGSTDKGRLEIIGSGKGTFRIGTISIMPADNIKGMRPDTLKLLKELNSPIYRWPGGNFASGYDWRDGIGDRDKRQPLRNPAWQGLEQNDFGFDEFMEFCREIGTEPLVTVNSGLGDDHSAAEEVEYANGSTETPMGKQRAANGHREPYGVKWWCIGNEMYGRWQLGYMSLEQYVRKHNLFAKAMRKVDPTVELTAVGEVGRWSEGMLRNCADYMDLISEHFYKGEKESVMEHVRQAPDAVRGIVTPHRDYRKRFESLKGKDIRIAIDEWNYWYGEHVFGELGTRYFMKDALGVAAGLQEMIRNSDIVFMANYAQTVNVIGAIKTTKTAAAFETTGLALKLYREHFGEVPVAISGEAYPLDVAAAWTKGKKTLTIGIVNPTDQKYELPMELQGAKLTGKGTLRIIVHNDPMAYNEPGKEPKVVIEEKAVSGVSSKLDVQPFSVNIYELAVR